MLEAPPELRGLSRPQAWGWRKEDDKAKVWL